MGCIYEPATHDSHGESPGAQALRAYCLAKGFGSAGIYNPRNVRGGSTLSLHAEGRAFDLTRGDNDDADITDLCMALVFMSGPLGIQQVIWQRADWRCSSGWTPYGGVDPHTSHAHIELTRWAASHLTVATLRLLLDTPLGDDMPTAQEIAKAILDEPIKTTYDVDTPTAHEVSIPLRTVFGNWCIQLDRIVRSLG
jgi:hypothetical protein